MFEQAAVYFSFFIRKRTAAFILVFLLCSTSSYTQAYYYIETTVSTALSPTRSYFTFLNLGQDGKGSARIIYKDELSGQTHRVDLPLVDTLMSDSMFLIPGGEHVDLSGLTDTNFLFPRIAFRKDSTNGERYYTPVSVDYSKDKSSWLPSVLSSLQEKTIDQLLASQELVRIFYSQDDEFYNYLYNSSTRGPFDQRKETMFLIVVANTLDPTIGKSSEKDFNRVSQFFTSLANDMRVKLKTTLISNESFSKANVVNAINGIRPGPNDILVFYYSGHGFRYSNDSSKYPRLSMRRSQEQDIFENNLSLENDVFKKLKAKGARVNLVIGDCCNNDPGIVPPVGRDILSTRGTLKRAPAAMLNKDNCAALLFPTVPVSVLVGSAEISQLAVGNPSMGGFFTNFFTSELQKTLYGPLPGNSWLKVLVDAGKKATYQSLSAICDSGRCVQRAAINVDQRMVSH